MRKPLVADPWGISDLWFLLELRGWRRNRRPFFAPPADDVPGSSASFENHRCPRASGPRPCEDLRPMLLAPGAPSKGGLTAEEFHVLPAPAQRPAAAVRAQIAEPDLLCIIVYHVRLSRAPLWKSQPVAAHSRPATKKRSWAVDRVADPVRTETGPDRERHRRCQTVTAMA